MKADALAEGLRGALHGLVLYVGGAVLLGSTGYALSHPERLAAMFANALGFDEELIVLRFVGGAFLLLVAASLAFRRRRAAILSWSPVLLAAPCVSGLAVPAIERDHPLLTLLFCVGAASSAGVAVYRAWPAPTLGREPAPLAIPERWRAALAAGALALTWATYTFVFSRLSITNHHAMNTRAFDLGIYDNIFYQSIHGRPLGCSFVRGGYHGAAHFDPLLVLLSPVYLVSPRAEALLVLQSVWLGSAAIPIYLIAKNAGLDRGASFVIAGACLLHPALHGANLYEMHSLTLAIVPILWALYALEADRIALYGGAVAVALLTREDVSLFLCFVGLSAILRHGGRRRVAGLATLAGAVAYFAIVKGVFMTSPDIFNMGPDSYGFAPYFKGLAGDKGFGGFLLSLVTNPVFVIGLVFDEAKLTFLATMFVPLLFLPLASRKGRLMMVYGLVFTMLASNPVVFSTHFQYTATLLPVLFALAPDAIVRARSSALVLGAGLDAERLVRALVVVLAVSSVAASAKFGALVENASLRGGALPIARTLTPEERERYAWIARVRSQIPADASVTVTNTTGPHVSNRRRVYLLGSGYRTDFALLDEADPQRQADAFAPIQRELEAGTATLRDRRGTLVFYEFAGP